jgi:D-Tyr-tRNAtyr deacylase
LTDIAQVELLATEIQANAQGFEALGRLHRTISQYEGNRIDIDCRRLGWMDAQLGACLITIVQHARKRNNQVYFNNIAPRIKEILQKNKTLQGNVTDIHGTTMPVTPFTLDDEIQFAHFTRQNFSRKQMPRMSKGLKEKFYEGIDELFANSSLHSKSDGYVFASGQFFPRLDTLCFLISDGGQGIQGSLAAAEKHFDRAADAIDWAMELNNSARSGDIPGGLGLGILKEFIGLNKGSLKVCSHTGYWEMSQSNIEKIELGFSFPGTVVSLNLNTSDRRSYHMVSKVDPNEIW